MVMNEVKSSAIKAVGFDPRTREMAVEFTSGDIYLYEGVSLIDFAELMNAQSKGVYFHHNIKPCYTGQIVL
jgi:hypothetical protein